jgi:hypothetical protein
VTEEQRPAAWYPAATLPGQQRYWDGAAWTEHVAPLARKTHPVRWALAAIAVFVVFVTVGIVHDLTTGTNPVTLLSVGQCLGNNPDTYGADSLVEDVKVVPCSGQHFMEVFHIYEHAATENPSDPGFARAASIECESNLPDYVRDAEGNSSLRLFAFNPAPSSWALDKSTACLLFRVDESSGAAQSFSGPLGGDS